MRTKKPVSLAAVPARLHAMTKFSSAIPLGSFHARHSVMRFLIPLLCMILAACQSSSIPICDGISLKGMGLSASERAQLERKASDGNAEAAWRLYLDFGSNRISAESWLRRAAKLDHHQAQRHLAYLIKEYEDSPKGFGATAPDAVRNLLERSARTEGDSCYDLASAYEDGYFGKPNRVKARSYFLRGAGLNNRMCWTELSRYCHHGLGGPRDDIAAYYWISLETRCVDPRSVSGQESWQAREEIASHLSLPVLEREWKRIDAFIDQVTAKKVIVDEYPFLSAAISPELEAKGRHLSNQREAEHRKKYKWTNAAPRFDQ